jgi:hypothetical protein
VIGLKKLLLIVPLVLIAAGCSQVKQQVVKDIAIEDQNTVLEQYKDQSAWTRTILEDIGDGGSIQRDVKVTIIDVNMRFTGAVTVESKKKHKKIVYALNIERPLTVEKIQLSLDDIFWFKDPMLRQVDYIRKWGKKTAQAIRDHEVFVGMVSDAAEESWGVPDKRNVNEVGGKKNEQWVYPVGKRSKYIYIIDGKVSKWED